MTRKNPRLGRLLVPLVAMAALALAGSPAHAIGFGGMGVIGGFNYVPSPTDFLNSHSLLNASRAGPPASNNVYAGNPNAYINRIRDNGFVPHSGIVDRRTPGYQASRMQLNSQGQAIVSRPPTSPALTSPGAAAAVAAVASARKLVVPIGSFFDASRILVWPSDSPVEGDLITKREISDQACLVVADLVEKFKSAPITTVTTARNRLLEYGQPALQFMRSKTTPRIAETFHQFLLSLYDSLDAAANPTAYASAANPTP